jgi:hypothetical protein
VRVAAASVNPVDVKTRSGVVPRLVTAIPRVGGTALAWGRVLEGGQSVFCAPRLNAATLPHCYSTHAECS